MDSNPAGNPTSEHLLRILLVEDSVVDTELTRELLAKSGCHSTLHVVRDGEQAMAFLRGSPPFGGGPRPDLVLLDLNLPRKDGREVLAEMKADDELRQIPVVVLSASMADEDVANAYANNANAYVRKPTDAAQYLQTLKLLEAFWLSVVRPAT